MEKNDIKFIPLFAGQ